MRARSCFCTLVTLLALALISGCGGSNSVGFDRDSASQFSPVSLSMTDAPPAGVTVLSFEVTLNSAVLNPGNVDLLAGRGPIPIEVKHLETEIGFINTANAAAGTYTSIELTFVGPELTFRNGTGAAIGSCLPSTVCEFSSSSLPGPLTTTINFPPPGLTIATNTPAGLLVDLNLNTLLTDSLGQVGVNFGLNGAATIQQLSLPSQPIGFFPRIENVPGIVVSKNTVTNRFLLETPFHGNLEVRVNNDTEFEDFDGCPAVPANFTCLQDGQAVEVDLGLIAGGIFFAREIELDDEANQAIDDALQGVIFNILSANQFEMVLLHLRRSLPGISLGRRVTVTILPGAEFRVDAHGLTVPSGLELDFEGATDTAQLMVGQHVQVRRTNGPPTNVKTNRVRLRMSRFTAKVFSRQLPNDFTVDNLSELFTSATPSITQIQVKTIPSETDFENVSGVSALTVGQSVSLRGLLFKGTPPSATLIADKVRARPTP